MRFLASLLAGQRCGRCGHTNRAHQHYRNGSDCGMCACSGFQWLRWWR